jgi:DNA-directed RNA polymerase specialized sigma24 family protein
VTITSARAEQIAAFYGRHAHRLRRTVAANAHAPEQTIEDACQSAWIILLRHPEVTLDHGGFAWLAMVAIREAWRLASRPRGCPWAPTCPATRSSASFPSRPPTPAIRPSGRRPRAARAAR